MPAIRLAFVMLLSTASHALAAWEYKSTETPMGGVMKVASVMSNDEVNFDFPYQGRQRARLALRVHPRYGRDVMLGLQKAHFHCSSVSGCSVLVRFDERPAVKFSATAPEDNSTTTLFIRDYARFLRETRASKRVRIEAQFYQQGTRVFDFNIAGLDFDSPSKPAPAKK